ncbi:hypothetical protein EJ08DRAFT_663812 [Tothia fuscella]|uniref:Uncharacterized protein n=1 Tax=Tothia fuscella TaxID=1048955 RepID=A0A9P4NKC1_9PEZI|nr:hypothetical protein EJ08DRAFT_663812 [Tothia fuscella]
MSAAHQENTSEGSDRNDEDEAPENMRKRSHEEMDKRSLQEVVKTISELSPRLIAGDVHLLDAPEGMDFGILEQIKHGQFHDEIRTLQKAINLLDYRGDNHEEVLDQLRELQAMMENNADSVRAVIEQDPEVQEWREKLLFGVDGQSAVSALEIQETISKCGEER